MKEDTIAAIATGMTDSGIGIIRISGEDAVAIGDRIFRSPSGKRILKKAVSHMLYYGFVQDCENGFIIDEVMAVVMREPRSFTGEDTVEIQCHGGVLVMRKILDAVLKSGARLAEPGEFTKRAFITGRLDLSSAEAVMDIIQSRNEYALTASVNQLRGLLSDEVRGIRSRVLYEMAYIESALDDPENYSLEGYPERLAEKMTVLEKRIKKLCDTFESGRMMKEGINTVIVGKPNVGKSSLMNCLVGEERAIVTDVAGTTRDILRENVRLGDLSLNVTDTAGIRETEDTVEKIGVERTLKYVEGADLIVYVVDASSVLDENDREIVSIIKGKKKIVLLNKSDLETKVTEEMIEELFGDEEGACTIVKISARDGSGMEKFEQTIKDMFSIGEMKSSNDIVVTNIRHIKALEETDSYLKMIKKSIEEGLTEDFFYIDLMAAYASLGKITGEKVEDDLVDEIFSKFCMGK